MKPNFHILFLAFALSLTSLCSCGDDMFDNDGKDAFIVGQDGIGSLTVKGRSGTIYRSRMSGDTIYIKINPSVDAEEELNGVTPTFYLSLGATVSPDPSQAQNFAQKGGVRYTVTSRDKKTETSYIVTYGVSDVVPYGEGYTLGQRMIFKDFSELGYPGQLFVEQDYDTRLHGDLNGYVAFCGHKHLILFARQYSDPHMDFPELDIATPQLAFRIYNRDDLSYAGNLNLGTIASTDVRAMTSDSKGTLLASVSDGANSEIYYWDNWTDAPKLLLRLDNNICSAIDGSNYLQAMGDIHSTANISAPAPRDSEGKHYMIHIENGAATNIATVSTGLPSDADNGWQMIAPLSTIDRPSFATGYTENRYCYISTNAYSGKVRCLMPNVLNGDFEQYWQPANGMACERYGARNPYVSPLLINGKTYLMVMMATDWDCHNDVVDAHDLHSRVAGCGTGFCIEIGVSWSFGTSGDWFYDEDNHEAWLAYYNGRYGISIYRLTCYE